MTSVNVPAYVTWADHVYNPWLSEVRTVGPTCGTWECSDCTPQTGRPDEAMGWANDSSTFMREAGRRQRVFAGPWCRTLSPDTPSFERDSFWRLVRSTRALDWLVLEDEGGRDAEVLPTDWGHGYTNVWVGAKLSGSGAARVLHRLKGRKARMKFALVSPMHADIGEVDLRGIDWVILSAEPVAAREFDRVASLRLLCSAYGVPCWFETLDATGAVVEVGQASRQLPKLAKA